MTCKLGTPDLLEGTRAYLSGPMDFVASRADEAVHGWRSRVQDFLRELGVVVLNPWSKPEVRGLHDYGREGLNTAETRSQWTFETGYGPAKRRFTLNHKFRETLHIDLRMVDTSDFLVAYCPTNIYSVGTPHEIALARQQRKPVLMVSPPITFPTLAKLRGRVQGDETSAKLLDDFLAEAGVKENPQGLPSLWYMALVDSESFFDGFGFAAYRERFGWERLPIDAHEESYAVRNPLLPFLERLNSQLPRRWDDAHGRFGNNDDWLLWDFVPEDGKGAMAAEPARRPAAHWMKQA